MSTPSKEVIQQFGEYDFDRITKIDDEDIKHICEIPENDKVFKLVSELLKTYIQQGRIHIMDKEGGVAFAASGVIGFKNDKLLIFSER